MKIDIIIKNGRVTVNGKTHSEMNPEEKRFLNDLIKEVKLNIKHDGI